MSLPKWGKPTYHRVSFHPRRGRSLPFQLLFTPRTCHPTCHWQVGLNHCSSGAWKVNELFYLPPPLLLETHIMKTCKRIARVGCYACPCLTSFGAGAQAWRDKRHLKFGYRSLFGESFRIGIWEASVGPHLLQMSPDRIIAYQPPITRLPITCNEPSKSPPNSS